MTRSDPGVIVQKDLPDGRNVCVYELIFGGRMLVSRDDKDSGAYAVYDYDSLDDAVISLLVWDGEGDPVDGRKR